MLHALPREPRIRHPVIHHAAGNLRETLMIDGSHQRYRLPYVKLLPNTMLFSRQQTVTVTSGLTTI